MKNAQNNRFQRSRNTGRRFPNQRGGSFESNGPEVKVRGTAQQVLEKYQSLARDAYSAGDRILSEGYWQHAEHYLRILSENNESQGRDGNNRPRTHGNRDEDMDAEFGDDENNANDQAADDRNNGNVERNNDRKNDRNNDRGGEGRPQTNQNRGRGRGRRNGAGDAPERNNDAPRADTPQPMIAAEALQERASPDVVKPAPPVQQSVEAPAQVADDKAPAKPRGRGRPRKVVEQPNADAAPGTTPAGD